VISSCLARYVILDPLSRDFLTQ